MAGYLLMCTKCGKNFVNDREGFKAHVKKCTGRNISVMHQSKPVEKVESTQGFKKALPPKLADKIEEIEPIEIDTNEVAETEQIETATIAPVIEPVKKPAKKRRKPKRKVK